VVSTRRALLAGWLALVTATAVLPGPSRAAEDSLLENRVKAAFLYKFAGFVDWPPAVFADDYDPFTIAVVGGGVVADVLA